MKRLGLLMLLALLSLSACAEKETERYVYTGSGAHWEVDYTVDVNGETNEESQAVARYIGEGDAPEMIDYRVTSSTSVGSFGGESFSLQDDEVRFGQSSCTSCAVMQGDEELEVNIFWNDEQETIFISTGKDER